MFKKSLVLLKKHYHKPIWGIFFTVIGGFIVGLINDTASILFFGIFLVVWALAYGSIYFLTKRYSIEPRLSLEKDNLPMAKVAVSAVSPLNNMNYELITNLIVKHGKTLEKLFLVCNQTDTGIQNAINAIIGWLEQNVSSNVFKKDQIQLIHITHATDIEEIYKTTAEKIDQILAEKVKATEIVLDTTAGFKTFSIAFTLLAKSRGCHLTYQAAMRDGNGDPMPNQSEFVLLKLVDKISYPIVWEEKQENGSHIH